MPKRTITNTEVIEAITDTETLDEAAERLKINITELRELARVYKIDLTPVETIQNYYFTFGSGHDTVDGIALNNSYVRVIAKDYGEARNKFIENFTSIYMSAKDKFAFQYKEGEIDLSKRWFPNGEYMIIE